MSTRTKNEAPMGASAPICIGSLSIAPRFRNCKRGQGNFLHFGRYNKKDQRFWAKWRKIRASLRPWPPLGGGCRRSRLGERNYVLRLSLRRPTGDTSLTEGGKREGRGSTPPETLCKIGGRGRTPPLHTGRTMTAQGRGCGAKKGPPVGGPFLSYFARLFRAYLLFSLPK